MKNMALLLARHTDVVEETRQNSEADTEEALSWTGSGHENHDEEWF